MYLLFLDIGYDGEVLIGQYDSLVLCKDAAKVYHAKHSEPRYTIVNLSVIPVNGASSYNVPEDHNASESFFIEER